MLQEAKNAPEEWPGNRPVGQKQAAPRLPAALVERFLELGFEIAPLCDRQADRVGGVPLAVPVRRILQTGEDSTTAISEILNLLEQRVPLVLSLTDLGCDKRALHNLRRFCEMLQTAIAARQLCGADVGLCVFAQQLPLATFQALAKVIPGKGARYVLLDSSHMTETSTPERQPGAGSTWSFLWQNRMLPEAIKPCYASLVRTACPLLADEVAASILPIDGVQVPAGSAWLPLRLSLPAFASEAGDIRWERLLPTLAEGVALAEAVLEYIDWPHPAQHTDAWLNRRVALSIVGLGELIARRGSDPRDLETLTWLTGVMCRIRRTLWHRSGRIAQEKGYLPSLAYSDPSRDWADHPRRDDWRRHWQAALEKSAVRHRNLLVLSPYSVLPAGASARDGYTDLLPVIAYADAWSFAAAPAFRDWSLDDYVAFHRRAWAIIQHPRSSNRPLQPGYDLI